MVGAAVLLRRLPPEHRDENVVRLGVVPFGQLPNRHPGGGVDETLGGEAIDELVHVEAGDRRER